MVVFLTHRKIEKGASGTAPSAMGIGVLRRLFHRGLPGPDRSHSRKESAGKRAVSNVTTPGSHTG